MHSVHGYYNGSAYVALEPVEVKPNQKVIITILDEDKPQREKITLEKLRSFVGSEGQSCPSGMTRLSLFCMREFNENFSLKI